MMVAYRNLQSKYANLLRFWFMLFISSVASLMLIGFYYCVYLIFFTQTRNGEEVVNIYLALIALVIIVAWFALINVPRKISSFNLKKRSKLYKTGPMFLSACWSFLSVLLFILSVNDGNHSFGAFNSMLRFNIQTAFLIPFCLIFFAVCMMFSILYGLERFNKQFRNGR